jgi:hypothetical protein
MHIKEPRIVASASSTWPRRDNYSVRDSGRIICLFGKTLVERWRHGSGCTTVPGYAARNSKSTLAA